MAEPIKFRTLLMTIKNEPIYAAIYAPTNAAGLLAKDVEIRPMEGADVPRDIQTPYLGGQGAIPAGLHAVITFSTELAPSGTAGTVPAWGGIARACGLAEVIVGGTSVTYSPISETMESIVIFFWFGGTLHSIRGARGTAQLTLNAQAIPVIRWTITGLYSEPAEAAREPVSFAGFQKPQIASNTNTPSFTVNGVSLVMSDFALDLGNDVQNLLKIGREEIAIIDRAEEITAKVEAVDMATFNPFALAAAQTDVAVSLVHGTGAGRITTLTAPKCQLKRLGGYENAQDVLEWPLSLMPLPNAGNDQFTLALT